MPQRRELPGQTLRELRDLIGAGPVQSQAEAARQIGVSRERIRQVVAQHRPKLKKPPAALVR